MSANEGDEQLDIDGSSFNPDVYCYKIATEYRLREIMDNMEEIAATRAILESELQTLVYENYNKFISATDTVRKMKSDFRRMEDTLDSLETNMESITSFSEGISSTLHRTRQKISRLSSVHALLKRLEFLFELPTNLRTLTDRGEYAKAAEDYSRAQRVLEKYGNVPSFDGIRGDCEAAADELRAKLRVEFRKRDVDTESLAKKVQLLLRLKEPADSLCAEFLSYVDDRLSDELELLADARDNDILEFMDATSSGFLGNLCHAVASCERMFVNRSASSLPSALGVRDPGGDDDDDDDDGDDGDDGDDDTNAKALARLDAFVLRNVNKYFELVTKRIDRVGDTALLVRALDRFHKRLRTINGLCTETDFSRRATTVAINAGKKQCRAHLDSLKQHLAETMAKVRQSLATRVGQETGGGTATATGDRGAGATSGNPDGGLVELEALLVVPTIEKVKGVLHDLSAFLQPDLSFNPNKEFLRSFGVTEVREGLVVAFLEHTIETASGFVTGSDVPKFPPALLLLLSKMCLEFKESGVRYLLTTTDETFNVRESSNTGDGGGGGGSGSSGSSSTSSSSSSSFPPERVTSELEMCDSFQKAARHLLNHYVRLQGLAVSRMLRKSVETRDWLHTIEPRTVRAVMKRVVEDVTAIEAQVTALYEDASETLADRSSDSSRKTHSASVSRHRYRSNWSSYASSHLDSSLVTNIHKLFSERIEIFSSVQFNKASILTGVVKISLKTFLECVRLRTFSKYGLQQIQVDTHYLQLYLWRFVTDENLVHFLLDEILGSAVHRCLEPVLMEPSVVDIICERG